jgi:hypothetical protein
MASSRAFVAGVCYSSRFLTDGVVHQIALAKLAPTPVRNELIRAGLWHGRADGGIEVHDYLEWNRDAESVKADRKANAERRKRHRERNAVTNAVSNGTQSSPVQSYKPSSGAARRKQVWKALNELFGPAAPRSRDWGRRHKSMPSALT